MISSGAQSLTGTNGTFITGGSFDGLTDIATVVLGEGSDTSKVVNFFETDGFKNDMNQIKEWYDAGCSM